MGAGRFPIYGDVVGAGGQLLVWMVCMYEVCLLMRQGAIAVMGLSSSASVSYCESCVRVRMGSTGGLSSLSDLVSSVVFGPTILLRQQS